MNAQRTTDFVTVCRLDDLVTELGVAAILPATAAGPGAESADGVQVALFRMTDDSVFAVQHHDPFADANVLARGLVGTHSDDKLGLVDEPVLSSPMYKQVWSLRTGACLDAQGKPPQDIAVYPTRVVDGVVQVATG